MDVAFPEDHRVKLKENEKLLKIVFMWLIEFRRTLQRKLKEFDKRKKDRKHQAGTTVLLKLATILRSVLE